MKPHIYFDPKVDKYPYPNDTGAHYMEVVMDRGFVFDENYPYIDKSKSFRFKQTMVNLLLHLIVYPMTYIKMGLKIEGKHNLKKHKKEIKNGLLTVSNHVHKWDYLMIKTALHKYKTNVLVWNKNVNDKDGPLVRLVGGVPIPEKNDVKANLVFLEAVHELFSMKRIIQLYAEGSMWEYYAPIRPFKPGIAYFAFKENKPVLPFGFSYRKPGWIRRKIFHQIATFTLNIGEPIYINRELDHKAAQEDLLIRLHNEVCRLSYIRPDKNIYEPIYNSSKKIDY